MWKDPEVGQQYEYHEAGYCAIVEVVKDISKPGYKQWEIEVIDPVHWFGNAEKFTFGYAEGQGYRPGSFYPLDVGNPYMPPETRHRRGH